MIASMLRLYAVIALAAILSIAGIEKGINFFFEADVAAADEAEYSTAAHMLRHFLGDTADSEHAGLAQLARISPGQYVAQTPAQVAALPQAQQRSLQAVGFSHTHRADAYGYDRYIALQDGAVIAVRARTLNFYWIRIWGMFLVFLMLLAGVLFWSVPHWRDLGKLGQAVARFGAGDLAARAKLSRYTTVKALSEHFNNMAQRLAQLVHTQRDLLNAASHELRTPLSRLAFGLATLRETIAETVPHSPALARIDALGDDVGELNALVAELLTYGMLEQAAAGVRLELVNVVQLFSAAAPSADALARCGASLRWEVEAGVMLVQAEPASLRRAFSNLLQNAMRYAASSITVRIEAAGPQGWRLIVEDDGPGIPEQERSRVFEPFYRLDRSRDRATGGYGLGLAIVQRVAERHGGVARAESSAVGGARLVVELRHCEDLVLL